MGSGDFVMTGKQSVLSQDEALNIDSSHEFKRHLYFKHQLTGRTCALVFLQVG